MHLKQLHSITSSVKNQNIYLIVTFLLTTIAISEILS